MTLSPSAEAFGLELYSTMYINVLLVKNSIIALISQQMVSEPWLLSRNRCLDASVL
jgi:hypothetical protein